MRDCQYFAMACKNLCILFYIVIYLHAQLLLMSVHSRDDGCASICTLRRFSAIMVFCGICVHSLDSLVLWFLK